MKKQLSIYIHIPFCALKCRYCDFCSFDGENYATMLHYVDAVCNEIKLYKTVADEYSVCTVFIGGGTPSMLDESLIVSIMDELKKTFSFDRDVEITIEANPGTLRHQKLISYRAAGINRLSIGLQSADDELLKRLGRVHNYDQFVASFNSARRAGFKNINIDVMSGLPGQSIHTYVDTLSKVIDFSPEHISAYSLIIEEGTPFASDPDILNSLPTEMIDRRMYDITKKLLAAAGYDRYEISNYARSGYECRHNMVYWTGGEYIGIGLNSASYFQGKRFSNIRDLHQYISIMEETSERLLNEDNLLIVYSDTMRRIRENITPMYIDSRMEEFMFLGLRMMCGVSRTDFQDRFKKDIYEVYAPVLNKYIDMGLLATYEDRIYLTDAGIDVSNTVMADFILDK